MYGDDVIKAITVTGNIYGANGHCYVLKDTFLDPKILYGGIVAENLCGYTRAKRPYGTDGEKIRSMVKCKKEQSKLFDEVNNMLAPFKNAINELSEWAMEEAEWAEDEYWYSFWANGMEVAEKLKQYGIAA